MTFQLTFDCAEARSLAAFWAAVLGYKPADPPAGFATWGGLAPRSRRPGGGMGRRRLDRGPERWRLGKADHVPQGSEPKTAKNRIHMDLDVADRTAPIEEQVRDIDREVARIDGLGGTKLRADRIPTHYHVVMQDPEGNEFCVR